MQEKRTTGLQPLQISVAQFNTLLTGVFNSRLIPSDIRRYLGSTVSVTFLVPKDIFLAGFSSTANREGLWSFRPNKLVNSMLVMLPRVSLDPV